MTEKQKFNLLVVEDDHNLGILLEEFLKLHNYDVTLCRDGVEGYHAFNRGNFDMCLVDIMMPKKDGFTLAEEIREKNTEIPIVFLTARSLKEDKIKGFKIGADDYITKPFSMEVLQFRIEAILRRVYKEEEEEEDLEFKIGQYTFTPTDQQLTLNGETKRLTTKENDLLKMLCQNMNKVTERDKALKKIWFEDNYFTARSMDVFITKLRKYLKGDDHVEIINVHGTGYKLLVKD